MLEMAITMGVMGIGNERSSDIPGANLFVSFCRYCSLSLWVIVDSLTYAEKRSQSTFFVQGTRLVTAVVEDTTAHAGVDAIVDNTSEIDETVPARLAGH